MLITVGVAKVQLFFKLPKNTASAARTEH